MPLKPFDIPEACHLIEGAWIRGEATIQVTNPSDGSPLTQIARGGKGQVDAAVAAAHVALGSAWGKMTAVERGRILTRIGQAVLEHVETLALVEALDVGKPLKQARADALA